MSKTRKQMDKRDFLRICEQAGCEVSQKNRHGEFQITFPDGYRVTGNDRQKRVGRKYLTIARRNGIDV